MGQVMVYTGLGKGKITAALGLAYRVLRHGGGAVIMFLTGPEYPQMGDIGAAATLGGIQRMVEIKTQARDLTHLAEFVDFTATVQGALALAQELLTQGECDPVVPDDINPLLHEEAIDTAQVIALIDEKRPQVDLVLSGRFAPKRVMDRADTVTDLAQMRHPSQVGIGPRKGFNL